jgi:hypothetical protein
VVVPANGTAEADFVANNPGATLFHCHNQTHMDFGFMTLLRYTGMDFAEYFDGTSTIVGHRSVGCRFLEMVVCPQVVQGYTLLRSPARTLDTRRGKDCSRLKIGVAGAGRGS